MVLGSCRVRSTVKGMNETVKIPDNMELSFVLEEETKGDNRSNERKYQ